MKILGYIEWKVHVRSRWCFGYVHRQFLFRCKVTHYFCIGKINMGKYSNWEQI